MKELSATSKIWASVNARRRESVQFCRFSEVCAPKCCESTHSCLTIFSISGLECVGEGPWDYRIPVVEFRIATGKDAGKPQQIYTYLPGTSGTHS